MMIGRTKQGATGFGWAWGGVLLAAGFAACGGEEAATDAGDDMGDGVDDGAEVEAGPDPLECGPRGTPLPLDSRPAAGEAVAGAVTRASELLTGEAAFGRVGNAFKLANHEVAFIVQGSDSPSGYNMYGGSLIDAAPQEGGDGNETFRELFPIVGWRVPSAESIAVLCDGSEGRAAVVRVEGPDAPSRLLPQIDALSPRPLGFRIVTDYILEPDARAIRVRTTVHNEGARTWGDVMMGDLLLLGAPAEMFTWENGFGDPTATSPTVLATATDPGVPGWATSYAYATAHGSVTLPIAMEGSTGAVGRILPALLRGASAEFERWVGVGNGDVSSAIEPVLEAIGKPFAVVIGTVTGEGGAPSAGALVAAFAVGGTGEAVGQARSRADGGYRLIVPPGSWSLVAAAQGVRRGGGSTGALAAGGTAAVDLSLRATGELVLDITEDGGSTPAKVTLVGLDAEAPHDRMGPLQGEQRSRGADRILFTPDGTGTFAVKPGRYRAVVTRGPEFGFVEQEVTIPVRGTLTLSASLERLVDTTGWIAGDFHVHTTISPDGHVTVCHRVLECVAEGLDFVVSTEHDGRSDYGPCIDAFGVGDLLVADIGNEVSNMGSGGHRNAYPFPHDPADPLDDWGPQFWVGLSAQELNDKLHALPTDPIVQMNHPRSTDSYLNWVMYDPVSGEVGRTGATFASGWDTIETSNGPDFPFDDVEYLTADFDETIRLWASDDRSAVPLFRDYVGLLQHGHVITAMGTSDVHGFNGGTGYSRSYLRLGVDAPADFTPADVYAAVRAQRVVVSNGVYLRVLTEGVDAMGSTEVVPILGSEVDLTVELQSVPGIDIEVLYVTANGRPLYLRRDGGVIRAEETAAGGGVLELDLLPGDALDEVVRLATEVVHAPSGDTFYHVLVRGSGAMGALPSSRPFAYTNAVYVDVDGGGFER